MLNGCRTNIDHTHRIDVPKPWGRWVVRGGILLLMGVLMALAYVWLDGPAHLRYGDEGHFWRRFPWTKAYQQLGKTWAAFWLLIVIAWVRKRPRMLVAALLALALMAAAVGSAKIAVRRPRPGDSKETVAASLRERRVPSYGFPSGDTAAAFALAAVAASFLASGWRVLPFAMAAGVGVVRVMTHRHFPSDVVGGAMVGLACAWVAMGLAPRIRRHIPARWWPRRRTLFWIAVILPIVLALYEGIKYRYRFVLFLGAFGPLVVVVLLAARGTVWLRWLGGRGFGPPSPQRRRMVMASILLVSLATLAVAPALGWTTLWDRDEGYYVECAREMLTQRDPFVPRFCGEPWLQKPPLTYWGMALSMALFHGTEAAARLPSAMAGVLAIWLTFWLAARMFDLRTGVAAACVLGTSVLFGGASRVAMLDTTLVCCVLLSMIGLWRFLDEGRRSGLVLFYVGCGLGGLAKGPLGIALPIIALIGYAVLTRSWRNLAGRVRPLMGILIVLAILAVWLAPATVMTRGQLLHELVWVRTLQPAFTPLQGHGGGDWLEYVALIPAYLPVLAIGFLPWSPLLLLRPVQTGGEAPREKRKSAFLVGWLLAQFVAFSLVRTKLPHHVLPMFPPLAILAATAALALTRRAPITRPRLLVAAWWILAATLFVIGGALLAVPFATGFGTQWPAFLAPAVLLMGLAIRASRQLARRNGTAVLVTLTAGTCLCFALVWHTALPRLEAGKSSRRVAEAIRARFGGDDLGTLRVGRTSYREVSVVYYLKHPVERVSDPKEFLDTPSPAVLILPERKRNRAAGDGTALAYRAIWTDRVWLPEKNKWTDLVILANPAALALRPQSEHSR